jgi:hypothetical protein
VPSFIHVCVHYILGVIIVRLAAKAWTNEQAFFLFIRWFAWQLDSRYPAFRDKGQHALLLVDGHSSRFNPDMLEYAMAHNIILLCYPANTTAKLQVNDVTLHGPLKNIAGGLLQALANDAVPLTTDVFIQKIIFPAWQQAFSRANILKGFKKTGIWPMNRAAIPEIELLPAKRVSDKPPTLESLVEELKTGADPLVPIANVPMKPLEDYFGGTFDTPQYKGSERKGKEPSQARILTNRALIDKERQKRETKEEKARRKAEKAAARAEKKAQPKNKSTRKKRAVSDSEDDEPEPEPEEEEDEAEDTPEEEEPVPELSEESEGEDEEQGQAQNAARAPEKTSEDSVLANSSSSSAETKRRSSKSSSSSSTDVKDGTASNREQKADGKQQRQAEICPKCASAVPIDAAVLCQTCWASFHLSCTGNSKRKPTNVANFTCSKCNVVSSMPRPPV